MTSLTLVAPTVICYMYIFADKFYRHIEHPEDQEFLQLAINALHAMLCPILSHCRMKLNQIRFWPGLCIRLNSRHRRKLK